MRITQYQSNFSTGEIDPLLRARTDLQQYQNALEEATNVVVQPQGGISRRDGLEFVFDFGSSFTEFKIIPFEFSTNDSYLLVFVVGRIYVFKNKNLQRDINSSGNDYITASDITAAMLDELEYTQAVDTLILCHEDLQTKRLVRNSDTSWTLENLPLTNPPQYAYALDEHSPNFTITPSATTGNITITASSVTTDTGTAQAGTANTITLKSASSYTSDDDPNGMWITLTSGTGAGQERYISDYVGSTKVATVYPAWTTQPDSSTNYKVAAFAASAINNFAQVENTFGRVKYISYVSDTVMNAVVEVPFFDTSGVVAGNWIGEFGYEDVWSSTRGWPRSATFHEGRLYFGGSKSRPNTVWGSRVIDYFNFDSHTGLDDEAVETTINTNQLNAIVNIVSGADLRIFSTGGEFIVVQSEDTPITPSNFLVRPQTRLGSKAGVPIEDLNGATIFVQRQGKAINAFQFGNDTRSYQVQNIALLSSHLLNTPVDIAVRRSSSTDEADRLFVVNSGDGSMAVYSILTGQNVIAPSKFTTDGEFIAIAVELSEVYAIVKRTVDSATVYYLEVFNSDFTLDSGVSGGAITTVQLGHLRGKTVNIIRDGISESAKTVSSETNQIVFEVENVAIPGTGFSSALNLRATFTGTDASNAALVETINFNDTNTTSWTTTGSFKSVSSIYIDNTSGTPFAVGGYTINIGISGDNDAIFEDPSGTVGPTVDLNGIVVKNGVAVFGSITLDTAATSTHQVGLNYTVQAKTMPTEPTLSSGSIHGMKKRIVQVDALVDKTKDLKINGKTIAFDTGIVLYPYQIIFEVENDSVPGTGFPSALNLRATFTGTDSSGAALVEIVNFNNTNTTSWTTTGSFKTVSSIAISNTSGTPQAVSGFTINIGISGDNDAIFVNIPDTIGPTINLNGTAVQDGVATFGLSVIAEYTGLKTAHGLLGYANTGQITLTQTDPLPMTVLGLEYKLSTGS